MRGQSIDSKKEEFRKYLESNGVVDALTKVIVGLYDQPEKPSNPLEFVVNNIGPDGPSTGDVDALKEENAELKRRNEEVRLASGALQPSPCPSPCHCCLPPFLWQP